MLIAQLLLTKSDKQKQKEILSKDPKELMINSFATSIILGLAVILILTFNSRNHSCKLFVAKLVFSTPLYCFAIFVPIADGIYLLVRYLKNQNSIQKKEVLCELKDEEIEISILEERELEVVTRQPHLQEILLETTLQTDLNEIEVEQKTKLEVLSPEVKKKKDNPCRFSTKNIDAFNRLLDTDSPSCTPQTVQRVKQTIDQFDEGFLSSIAETGNLPSAEDLGASLNYSFDDLSASRSLTLSLTLPNNFVESLRPLLDEVFRDLTRPSLTTEERKQRAVQWKIEIENKIYGPFSTTLKKIQDIQWEHRNFKDTYDRESLLFDLNILKASNEFDYDKLLKYVPFENSFWDLNLLNLKKVSADLFFQKKFTEVCIEVNKRRHQQEQITFSYFEQKIANYRLNINEIRQALYKEFQTVEQELDNQREVTNKIKEIQSEVNDIFIILDLLRDKKFRNKHMIDYLFETST